MVALPSMLVVLVAISTALAAPADHASASLAKRGPSNFVLEPKNALFRRASLNYSEDWTTGGTVNYTNSSTGFDLSWNTPYDFLVGVGWNPGSTAPITFDGSFSVTGGTALSGVYGWTLNPLVEYCVLEDGSNETSLGTQTGNITTDGSVYTIWKHLVDNGDPIEGTSAYYQYYSVRSSPRTKGTVSIKNHFDAWGALDMPLGTLNYQIVAVEGWQGSGSASYSVSS